MAWDDVFSDIQDTGMEMFSNWGTNVLDGVSNKWLGIGEPPKGNLTTAQINAGQRGVAENATISPPSDFTLSNIVSNKFFPLIIAGVVLLFVVILKRR